MSKLQTLKEESLKRLLIMSQQVRKEDCPPEIMGEYNGILHKLNDELGLDIRALSVKFGEQSVIPPSLRHADDKRPLDVAEQAKCFVPGDLFRDRIQEAIVQLDAFLPPKDRVGFV